MAKVCGARIVGAKMMSTPSSASKSRLRWARAAGGRILLLALLVLLLAPESEGLATPGIPAPHPSLQRRSARPILLARRRGKRPPTKKRATPHGERKGATGEDEASEGEQPAAAPAAASGAVDPGNLQRGGRVEFDGRLVQGQAAKSGAIYLFARKRSQLRSMVNERVDYRREVLRTVYPGWNGSTK